MKSHLPMQRRFDVAPAYMERGYDVATAYLKQKLVTEFAAMSTCHTIRKLYTDIYPNIVKFTDNVSSPDKLRIGTI